MWQFVALKETSRNPTLRMTSRGDIFRSGDRYPERQRFVNYSLRRVREVGYAGHVGRGGMKKFAPGQRLAAVKKQDSKEQA